VKLAPPCLSVDALTAAKVGAEIFDMDLDSCPVRGDQVQGHAPLLPDQGRVVAVGGERDLDHSFSRSFGSLGQQQQPLRRLARHHSPGAFPAARKEACSELTAEMEVALDLAIPAGETRGIGERGDTRAERVV